MSPLRETSADLEPLKCGWWIEIPPGLEDGTSTRIGEYGQRVLSRFVHFSGYSVVAVALGRSDSTPPLPMHPECGTCRPDACCQAQWSQDVEQIRRKASFRTHLCNDGRWCATVPSRVDRYILLVHRIVAPRRAPRAEVERHVDLLAYLSTSYVESRSASGQGGGPEPTLAFAPIDGDGALELSAVASPAHSLVRAAIDYVQRHLSDPGMNVAEVADTLDVNASYLGHLCSQECGVHLGQYIVDQRLRLGRQLLSTTTWQVKRIAWEVGFSSADWFTTAFHKHFGVTPTQYRRQIRSRL